MNFTTRISPFILTVALCARAAAQNTQAPESEEERVNTGSAQDPEPQPPGNKEEEIVVTGTRTEKLLEKTPVKTQVIGRKELDRMKATHLADALELTSGLRVENDCQNCGFTQVRLNGLEGRYTQILIDGNPVFSSLAGVYGLEQIPQEMIERIEIVKGGGSALYGGNAVGGVINVITARPRHNFANVTTRAGMVGMREPEFRLSTNAGVISHDRDLALHVFGGAYTREPWDANSDGLSEVGQVKQVMAGAETYWDICANRELELKFHILHEARRGGDSFDKPEHAAAVAESTNTYRYGGELRYHHFANRHLYFNVGYGFAYTERDSYYGSGGDVALSDPPTADEWEILQGALGAYGRTQNPLHTGDAMANISFPAFGEQIITLGPQFSVDGLEDRFPAYERVVDDRYWNVAGILQHNWVFPKWFETIVGARMDFHSELNDPVISPRAAFMFSPGHWLRTRTSFSTGFRAPQVFDEDLHITIVNGAGQVVYNDPNLDPETSLSLAQQIEFDVHPGANWEVKFGINGFLTRIKDAFSLSIADDPNTPSEMEMIRQNRGRTQVLGTELELEATYADRFGVAAGFTLEKAKSTEPDPDFGTRQLLRTPAAYGFAETYISLKERFDVSTMISITGPMKVPHYAGDIASNRLETSPWFFDWSANLSYRFDLGSERYVAPFLGIRNILDSRQGDYDRGPLRDAGYVYGPRLPRTLYVGIKGGI